MMEVGEGARGARGTAESAPTAGVGAGPYQPLPKQSHLAKEGKRRPNRRRGGGGSSP